jgi:hypothetical protein
VNEKMKKEQKNKRETLCFGMRMGSFYGTESGTKTWKCINDAAMTITWISTNSTTSATTTNYFYWCVLMRWYWW